MERRATNQSDADQFARATAGRQHGFFGEFWYFLRHNTHWWLTPVVLVIVVLGVLVVLAGTGAAPFIYTLF